MSGNNDDVRQRLRRSVPNYAQEALDTCIERLAAERALADDLADALDTAIAFLAPSVRERYPLIEIRLARWREARQR